MGKLLLLYYIACFILISKHIKFYCPLVCKEACEAGYAGITNVTCADGKTFLRSTPFTVPSWYIVSSDISSVLWCLVTQGNLGNPLEPCIYAEWSFCIYIFGYFLHEEPLEGYLQNYQKDSPL